jgi:hypothetical protein
MSEQLDTNLVFSDISTDAVINEITANDTNIEHTADISSIDFEALYANLELLSTVVSTELVSNVVSVDITALEQVNETLSNLTNKNIVGNKTAITEETAMLIGAFQYVPDKVSNTEQLVKVMQYNRELFEEFSVPEEISLQLTKATLDDFFNKDVVSLQPESHKEDIVMISELVTEELVKTLIKFFNDEARTIEFIDYYAGNQRGGHDGKRSIDAISMQPTTQKEDSRSSTDSYLLTVYKNIEETIHTLDFVAVAGGSNGGVSTVGDIEHVQDTLQIFLQNYFAEDYCSIDYVAASYTIQG